MASSAVLASSVNCGVATCFAAGNGGPLAAAFKAGAAGHSFTKLPILPNFAFGEFFVPSSYNFGACSHAKVRTHDKKSERERKRTREREAMILRFCLNFASINCCNLESVCILIKLTSWLWPDVILV